MNLGISEVDVHLNGISILDKVSIHIDSGELVGLVGPNGSGKSTLLRTIYRALEPSNGVVSLAGDDVQRIGARECARRVAVVVQERPSDFDFTVREVVELGRNPHKNTFDRLNDQDRDICEAAIRRVDIDHLAERTYSTLSGGEKQRVQLARALAQQCDVLVLDEPTNHLDIRHQLELLELVRELRHTTIAAIHDLNFATQYFDRVVVLHNGEVVAAGLPQDVFTTELIAHVFGVHVTRFCDPATGRSHLAFAPASSSGQTG